MLFSSNHPPPASPPKDVDDDDLPSLDHDHNLLTSPTDATFPDYHQYKSHQDATLPPPPDHRTLLEVRVDEEVEREVQSAARKTRRFWRIWTGTCGLVIEGWSVFLAVRYFFDYMQSDSSPSSPQLRRKLALAFFALSTYTVLTTFFCLCFVRRVHKPSLRHRVLPFLFHLALYMATLALVVPAAINLGLLLIWRAFGSEKVGTCGWGVDVIWDAREGACLQGTGWLGGVTGRLVATVVVCVIYHHAIHKTFSLLATPLPSTHHPISGPTTTAIEYDDDTIHRATRSQLLDHAYHSAHHSGEGMPMDEPFTPPGGVQRGWYDSADAEYLEPEDGARDYSSSNPAAGGRANDYSDGHDQQHQQRPQQYQHYSVPVPNLGGAYTRHQHQQQPDSGAPLLRTPQPVPAMTSSRFTHWTELSTVHSVGSYLEAKDANDGDAHSRGPSSGSSAHSREGSELRSRRREASEAQRGHDGEDYQHQHLHASGSNHEGDGQNGVGWLGGWWRG